MLSQYLLRAASALSGSRKSVSSSAVKGAVKMAESNELKEISRYFYSNCLVEAIKAKIRNPKVKIITHHISGTKIPHFLWENGENYLYDFGADSRICTPLMFKGCIRKRVKPREEAEAALKEGKV